MQEKTQKTSVNKKLFLIIIGLFIFSGVLIFEIFYLLSHDGANKFTNSVIFTDEKEFVRGQGNQDSLDNTEEKVKEINIEEAREKALDFMNRVTGEEAEIKELSEENDLYKLVIYTSGMEITAYMTKDGLNFFPAAMEAKKVEEEIPVLPIVAEIEDEIASEDTVMTKEEEEEVKVELFVMSFCPYGVIAEKAMAPVYDLLKEEVDIDIRYIASMPAGSDDINNVKSLHGVIEGVEDARQLCVRKYYGKDVFWNYIIDIDNKCYPIYRNGEEVYNDCWQTVAKEVGLSVERIDACVEEEGAILIENNDVIASQYKVTGSPTIIINGTKVQPTRTPEAFKQAICNEFENPPTVCDTVLSNVGGTASGGC